MYTQYPARNKLPFAWFYDCVGVHIFCPFLYHKKIGTKYALTIFQKYIILYDYCHRIIHDKCETYGCQMTFYHVFSFISATFSNWLDNNYQSFLSMLDTNVWVVNITNMLPLTQQHQANPNSKLNLFLRILLRKIVRSR